MKGNLLSLLSILVSISIGLYLYSQLPKTAYVESQTLFEAFDGKKELENQFKNDNGKKQAKLDSLSLQIQALQRIATQDNEAKNKMHLLQQQYQQLQQEYQGHYQYKSSEYTEAIWKQISQYTIEYGKANGYDYIYGVAGSGSLMYGKEEKNITKEVIKYINDKYAGN
ncbi:MAG: OmpH family outer membrane protein [Saprospiraceae bacterium]|nr:OmpH family outer membrane protein [Saprospiraceae bacterium]